MTDRWVCARCFTSAEESAPACPNCGLPRGATPESAAGEVESAADEVESVTAVQPAAQAEPAVGSVPAAAPGGGERWVCLRCFASNDGNAAACATCGLARGAEPTSEPSTEWVGQASVSPAGTQGRRLPTRLVLFGVIALVAIGATYFLAARRGDTGAITGAGDLSVFELQVGDCFDVTTDGTELESVRAIPCDEAHTYEAFWSGNYAGDVQPAEAEYVAWLEDQCLPAFETYVGLAYADSVFYTSSLSPTVESWADGDRSFTCYLHNQDESPMTGSARGAAE